MSIGAAPGLIGASIHGRCAGEGVWGWFLAMTPNWAMCSRSGS